MERTNMQHAQKSSDGQQGTLHLSATSVIEKEHEEEMLMPDFFDDGVHACGETIFKRKRRGWTQQQGSYQCCLTIR